MKHRTTKIKNKKYKAFSFVEVMVSVFLVTVGMMAVISLMTSTLNNSIDSRNQIVATLLAQEGVELMRNIRDNNWESQNPDGSFDHLGSNNNCRIDKTYVFPANIVCGSSYGLNVDGNGFYTHSAGAASKFQRKIIISDSGTDKNVISMVSWNGSVPPGTTVECNTASKCAYTQIILGTYGE
jgi:Tfp pilus assembly protein PilV